MANMPWASDAFDAFVFLLFGKLIARQFVVFGGVPAALARGKNLRQEGIIPTYNRIDEHVKDRAQIEGVLSSYIATAEGMGTASKGNLAIKPSAMGMEFGSFVFAQTLRRLIEALAGKNIEIEVDAESRETLCRVQMVLNSLKRRLPPDITFRPALQMHIPLELRKELVDTHRILDMPLRIVKGSGLYNIGALELSEGEVFAQYFETFRIQIANKKHPFAATVRDQELLLALTKSARDCSISPQCFTLQFLDGFFGRSLARSYVAQGYRVGRYVTFVDPSVPDAWKSYVKRRIAFGRKLLF